MDEIARLVEQVKILSDTVALQSERLDQLYNLQSERLDQLFKMQQAAADLSTQRDLELKQAIDSLSITDQALKDALNDVDGVTDDLATVAAALLQFQKGQTGQNVQ